MIDKLPPTVAANIDRFTGRTWLLPPLLDWLEHGDQRIFLLIGGPGTGKSMITAWLAGEGPMPVEAAARQQLERLRAQVKACHFCVAASGSTDPKELARQMVGQLTRQVPGFSQALAATLGDQVRIASEQHVGRVEAGGSVTGVYIANLDLGGLGEELSFNRILRDPLKRFYEDGYDEPMLLLVDSLDEAQTYTGGTNIVQLIAKLTDLPPQVRILATTRPDPPVLKLFHEARSFDLIEDAPASVDDVKQYVLEQLQAKEGLDGEKRNSLATRISQAAKGIFLYAYVVLDDLLPLLTDIPDLETYPLPDELSGLYHNFLNRELGKDEDRWYESFRPVLGLIAVSQGEGLTRAQLEAISGKEVEQPLRRCKQYLDGKLPDGPFRVFHKSFADFLLAEDNNVDYRIDAAAMHRRIAEYFEEKYRGDWLQCQDEYALAYLPAHLMSLLHLEQTDEISNALRRLLTDLRFLERKTGVLGVFAALTDVAAARLAFPNANPDAEAFGEILRVLDSESHHLRAWNPHDHPGYFAQQFLHRATRLQLPTLASRAADALAQRGIPYFVERWGSGHPSDGLLRTLVGHSGTVWSVAVCSDGTRVTSAGDDGTVRVWRLDTGEEEKTLVGHQGRVRAVAKTSEGHRIVSAGADGTVRVWDLGTGQTVQKLEGHGCEVLSLVDFPDSSKIASGDEKGLIRIWDLQHGSSQTFRAHSGEVRSLAVVANTNQLVSASSDRRIRIWNSENLELLASLEGDGATFRAVCVSLDQLRVYAAASDGTVKAWALKPEQQLDDYPPEMQYKAHRGRVRCVTVSEDGEYVISGGEDRLLKIWNATSPTGANPIGVVQGHSGPIWGVATIPQSSLIVSASDDGAIKIWDIARLLSSQAAFEGSKDQFQSHGARVQAIIASGDGSVVLSGAQDGTLKYWSALDVPLSGVHRPPEIFDLSGHTDEVTALVIGSTSRIALSGSRDKTLKSWDLVEKSELRSLKGHRKAVTRILLSPDDSRAVSASEDGTLILWRMDSGAGVVLGRHGAQVLALAMDRGMNRVISGAADGSVAIWNAVLPEATEPRDKEPIFVSHEHNKAVLDISVTADGQFAFSAAADGLLKVWALSYDDPSRNGQQPLQAICSLVGHEGPVLRVATSPDSTRAVSISSDGAVLTWDLSALKMSGDSASLRPSLLTRIVRRPIAVVALSDNEKVATISAQGSLDVWSMRPGPTAVQDSLKSIASVSLEQELSCLTVASIDGTFIVGDRVGDVACFNLVEANG